MTSATLQHCFSIERRETIESRVSRFIAPAVFKGMQSGFGVMPDIELWNLTADIPGHTAGATLSRETIVAAGYLLPLRRAA